MWQDADLKQAAVYGLGVAAVKRQEAFSPMASQAHPRFPLHCNLLPDSAAHSEG